MKDSRDRVMRAFIRRACGYKTKEEVRELKEIKKPDGTTESELVLTKVISRDVPADLAAARWYLEGGGQGSEQTEITLQEAQRMIDESDE
jgi:hypothetical protein